MSFNEAVEVVGKVIDATGVTAIVLGAQVLGERLDATLSARTYGDLERQIRDLVPQP